MSTKSNARGASAHRPVHASVRRKSSAIESRPWEPTPQNDPTGRTRIAARKITARQNREPDWQKYFEQSLTEFVAMLQDAFRQGFICNVHVSAEAGRLRRLINDWKREEKLERMGLSDAYNRAKKEAARCS